MADIEIKIDFEHGGKKYHVNPYGLMCGNSIVLYKDWTSYKVGECFCYPSKDKLMARIDDKTYDEIGQPKKLYALFRPIEESVADEKTTIHTFSLCEVYFDDDCSVTYEKIMKRFETPQAKSPQDSIVEVCDSIKELLLEKNRKFGNSALNPCRVFSKADSVEQLKVRIDDKISRIKNEQTDEDEDVVKDLIGYLVLLVIARGNGHAEEEI